jgi:hypothetical protein
MYDLYSQNNSLKEFTPEQKNRLRATALIGTSLLEGFVLYKVLSTSTKKGWPLYVLGSAVGVNILGKLVAASLVFKS